MRARGQIYSGVALGVSVLVGLAGAGLTGSEGQTAAWVGALAAGGIQAIVFALLPHWLGPGRRLLMYGLGTLARFAMFAAVALVGLPLLRLPAAPLLFALVTVFFLTTLLEPFFLHTRSRAVS